MARMPQIRPTRVQIARIPTLGQTARQTFAAPDFGAPSFATSTIPQQVSGTAPWSPPAAPARVSQTASQVANQRVNAILNPQIAAQTAAATQQNAAIKSFAQALMGRLEPIAGQVGQDYSQAIQQTGALANQAATFLQQANPTPQVQALLQSAGAPAEQQAQLAGQLGQQFGGGAAVLNFLGGTVPGTKLAEQGAAAQAQAAQYPALAALRGQQDLASALVSQQTAMNKITAQRGQLYSDALQDIRTNQLKQQQLGIQRQTRADTLAYHQASIRQAGQRLTAQQQHYSAQETQAKINEVDRATNNRVTALISEGFDPATGKLTPKVQAQVDKTIATAEAAKNRLIEQHRHNVAGETVATTRAQTAAGTAAETVRHHKAMEAAAGQRAGLEQQRVKQGWVRIEIQKQAAAAKKAGNKGIWPNLSKTQVQHLRSGIANVFYGVPEQKDVSGKVTRAALPAGNYQQAITEAVKHGYSRAGATKMANRFYKAGFRGRPGGPPPVKVSNKGPLGAQAVVPRGQP